jgi:hypothetical protein
MNPEEGAAMSRSAGKCPGRNRKRAGTSGSCLSVILSTQGERSRGSWFKVSPGQIVLETLSQKKKKSGGVV